MTDGGSIGSVYVRHPNAVRTYPVRIFFAAYELGASVRIHHTIDQDYHRHALKLIVGYNVAQEIPQYEEESRSQSVSRGGIE